MLCINLIRASMGEVCCKGNIDTINQLGEPISTLPPLEQELYDGPNEPDPSFAKPFNDDIEFLPTVDDKSRDLGPFEYPTGRGVPRGKILSPYKLTNGIVYTGEWQKGEIHGKGMFMLPNQTVIYCLTSHNKVTGKGRVIYPNGDYYQGEIQNNKANGRGKYVEGSISFQGEFKDNIPHGDGVQTGQNYEFDGKFEEGVKVYGKLNWTNGNITSQYTGPFLNNQFEGKGTLNNDEGKYVGTFQNGKKHGTGKLFYKHNSQYYQGQFQNDMRSGQGFIMDEMQNKIVAEGHWFKDNLQQ